MACGRLADFGGDHKSDILWRSDSGGVALWQMNGSQIAANTSLGTVARNCTSSAPAISTATAKPTFCGAATMGRSRFWQMDGAALQSNQIIGVVGHEWHVDGTGDFNGDGKADILWRADDGTAVLWTMDGAHITSQQTIASITASSALSVHHYDFV